MSRRKGGCAGCCGAPSNWDYQPAATGSIGLCQLTTKFLFKTCSQPNGATLQEAVPGPSSGGCQIQRLVGVKGLLLFNAEQFLSSSGQFHSIYSIKWVEVNLSCAYTVLVSWELMTVAGYVLVYEYVISMAEIGRKGLIFPLSIYVWIHLLLL